MKSLAVQYNMNTDSLTGCVFNIQRFSLHDGPGIRTVVFLKGCQMRCSWCANPEGLNQNYNVLWRADSCENCGICIEVCRNGIHQLKDSRHIISTDLICNGCRLCEKACPSQAIKIVGRWLSISDVYQEVKKDIAFYQVSGGGVTLSGGEVMLQPEFSIELLRKLRREGIHTAVETAGFAPWSVIEKVSVESNLVLYDLKIADDKLHQRFTGVSNTRIVKNLEKLMSLNVPIRLRIPVIPGVNDTSQEIQRMMSLIKDLTSDKASFMGIDLLPYHDFGVHKYSLMAQVYPGKTIKKKSGNSKLREFLEVAEATGIPAKLSSSMVG